MQSTAFRMGYSQGELFDNSISGATYLTCVYDLLCMLLGALKRSCRQYVGMENRVLLVALLVAAACAQKATSAAPPIFVDIHLPVRGAAYARARAANAFLNAALGNDQIDFATAHTPHVTLYLTAWNCEHDDDGVDNGETCAEQIEDAVESTMYELYIPGQFGPCEVSVGEPYAAGTYAMMNVSLDRAGCLQRYSDLIVNATYELSAPHQTVPSWVRTLPEPERSEKIHDIEKYGSPNVFSQFQPHVSIGWSDNASAIAAAVEALRKSLQNSSSAVSFLGEIVALGSVGLHGTVLQHADLAVFNVTDRRPCENYMTYADCKADNVTFGGCMWCDVVDHPAWCTTRFQAENLPRFPPHQCT